MLFVIDGLLSLFAQPLDALLELLHFVCRSGRLVSIISIFPWLAVPLMLNNDGASIADCSLIRTGSLAARLTFAMPLVARDLVLQLDD